MDLRGQDVKIGGGWK